MLKLRTSKKTHPQMQALMLSLLAELKEKITVIFNDINKGENNENQCNENCKV